VWLRVPFLKSVGFMDQRGSDTPQIMTTEWDVQSPSFCQRSLLPAIYPTLLRFILHHITHQKYFTTFSVHIVCRQMNLRQRQHIWLHRVTNWLASSPWWHYWIIGELFKELPLAMTVNLWNTPINIIHHKGMVTCLHSSHFHVLRSVITILYSTWPTFQNK